MRIDVYNHSDPQVLALLTTMNQKLDAITKTEATQMSVGQEILDKVTEAASGVDSLIALLNGLVASNIITDEVKTQILGAIQGQEDKVNAALNANHTG